MHKYWGKKPFYELRQLIQKHSKRGDKLLDPFAGYGVFVSEAYLAGRHVVGNDLNPASQFIMRQLLCEQFNSDEFQHLIRDILARVATQANHWYEAVCPKCGNRAPVLATLRNKEDYPLRQKIKCPCSKTAVEYLMQEDEALELKHKESCATIAEHPSAPLTPNSRISAKVGMSTDDLFPIRALACHAELFRAIDDITCSDMRNYLTLAFTSNIANCSKLVPPIKSRSAMAPGAWMTGFYVGDTYIENNVFHYFLNRAQKVLKGKQDFICELSKSATTKDGEAFPTKSEKNFSGSYLITGDDVKSLQIEDNSIDYVFTDPPYGDTVPYFEQSAIWNTWLGGKVDYANEIVISDSSSRKKGQSEYRVEIKSAVQNIWRVLKPAGHFTLTFHSLSGETWHSLCSACMSCGFEVVEVDTIVQKTFAPRQLNRNHVVKGDIVVTLRKALTPSYRQATEEETESVLIGIADQLWVNNELTSNRFLSEAIVHFFEVGVLFADINFFSILSKHYEPDNDGMWRKINR